MQTQTQLLLVVAMQHLPTQIPPLTLIVATMTMSRLVCCFYRILLCLLSNFLITVYLNECSEITTFVCFGMNMYVCSMKCITACRNEYYNFDHAFDIFNIFVSCSALSNISSLMPGICAVSVIA